MMRKFVRRLPHWDALGAAQFVTFRLEGSLPVGRSFPVARMTSGEAFVAMDRLLDNPSCGPTYLSQASIAGVVLDAIRAGAAFFQRYELHSFVIMPNHVHLLITPFVTSDKWLRPLKGFTGSEANRILGRHGAFWQHESYDRLVRDQREFERIRHYIEWNPVKAGLCGLPEEFSWSSATPGGSPAASQKA